MFTGHFHLFLSEVSVQIFDVSVCVSMYVCMRMPKANFRYIPQEWSTLQVFKLRFILFLIVYIALGVGMHCEYRYPQSSDEVTGVPGDGVIGSCGIPNPGAGS